MSSRAFHKAIALSLLPLVVLMGGVAQAAAGCRMRSTQASCCCAERHDPPARAPDDRVSAATCCDRAAAPARQAPRASFVTSQAPNVEVPHVAIVSSIPRLPCAIARVAAPVTVARPPPAAPIYVAHCSLLL